VKVILFGATGMVGQGVLRECLADTEITEILSIVRRASGFQHVKFREIEHQDFTRFDSIEKELMGFDACFFCLGISVAGMTEQAYRRITYDFALAAGQTLSRLNPHMTFIYVSGEGTDSTEKGGTMWARVKGEAENALLRLPFKSAYMFRPGYIQPLDGIVSKQKLYRVIYAVVSPLYPLFKRLFPKMVTNTRQIGLAMIQVAKQGTAKKILTNADINELAVKTN
jgi:uncharacterized protein YbjT (DUF2867 family)